jgi:hypothetical protein
MTDGELAHCASLDLTSILVATAQAFLPPMGIVRVVLPKKLPFCGPFYDQSRLRFVLSRCRGASIEWPTTRRRVAIKMLGRKGAKVMGEGPHFQRQRFAVVELSRA